MTPKAQAHTPPKRPPDLEATIDLRDFQINEMDDRSPLAQQTAWIMQELKRQGFAIDSASERPVGPYDVEGVSDGKVRFRQWRNRFDGLTTAVVSQSDYLAADDDPTSPGEFPASLRRALETARIRFGEDGHPLPETETVRLPNGDRHYEQARRKPE